MAEECPNGNGASRQSAGLLWERLRATKAAYVAERLHKDDTWFGKVRSGECGLLLEHLEPFLAALDLRIVRAGDVVVDGAIAQAYEAIVKKALSTDAHKLLSME